MSRWHYFSALAGFLIAYAAASGAQRLEGVVLERLTHPLRALTLDEQREACRRLGLQYLAWQDDAGPWHLHCVDADLAARLNPPKGH